MRKLNIGIIGPGKVTEQLIQHLKPVVENIDALIFYDHGSSSSHATISAQRETLFGMHSEHKNRIDFEVVPKNKFNQFMGRSDVIILNVGRGTPQQFLTKKEDGNVITLVDHFDGLEGLLERGAQEWFGEEQRKHGIPKEEYVADLITAYNVLKEIKTVQDETGYFPSPLRMLMVLPATLPAVMRYAYQMRKYFDTHPESPPDSKFLIVNSNNSEDNLNAILSILPQMRHSAVSLAIDAPRLMTLLNTDPEINLSRSCLLKAGVVGDHDCYIIPNFGSAQINVLEEVDKRKIEKFQEEYITNPENFKKLRDKMQQRLIDYYTKRSNIKDLSSEAGRGVVEILSSIADGEKVTSGYFQELGPAYGLSEGEGLCFVDEYTVSESERQTGEDGKRQFRIVPQPQELDEYATTRLEECKAARTLLMSRFINNTLIPVQRFPGPWKVGEQVPRQSTAEEIISGYRQEERRRMAERIRKYDGIVRIGRAQIGTLCQLADEAYQACREYPDSRRALLGDLQRIEQQQIELHAEHFYNLVLAEERMLSQGNNKREFVTLRNQITELKDIIDGFRAIEYTMEELEKLG